MIEMQMSKDHISDIIRSIPHFCQGRIQTVSAIKIIIGKEFLTLLVPDPGIDEDSPVTLFHQKATHRPITQIVLVAGIEFIPDDFRHHAKHSATVKLKITS